MDGYQRAKVGGGAQLAFTVHGPDTGWPVVLVHAGIADRHMYDRLLPLLPGHVRAVAYDQRGFGNTIWKRRRPWSHADDLLQLLDHLGIQRATLVGSSFGGYIALEIAAVAPDRVANLLLLAPPLPGYDDWTPELEAYQVADEAALREQRFDDSVQLDLRTWVDGPERAPEDVDPEIRRAVGDALRHALEAQRTNPLGPERDVRPEAVDVLETIDTETVIAVGDLDQTDFRVIAARLVGALPRATLLPVQNAGHLIAMERPDVVADQIAALSSP